MDSRLLTLAAVAVALASPAAAQATTSVAVDGGVLRVVGGSGQAEAVTLDPREPGEVEVHVLDRVPRPQRAIAPRRGRGCSPYHSWTVCSGFDAISVALGDRDDALTIYTGLAPFRYSGGPGRDVAEYGAKFPSEVGVFMDNDGVRDDGHLRADDVESDVEVLGGSRFDDTLGSHERGAGIYPADGADTVRGGSGPDRMRTAWVATDGTEEGFLFTEGADTISCGGGQDFVLHDLSDAVAADCEATGAPSRKGPYFLYSGSAGDDFLGAGVNWDPGRMYARAGDDVVQPPDEGVNLIDLGPGRDRTRETGRAANTVRGGSGSDSIDMRDADPNPGTRDTVACGSGRDRVLADAYDTVARDCESVARRARKAR